jgi:peptidyl-prolyl cis-trans isomerase B (cyclophilin B)
MMSKRLRPILFAFLALAAAVGGARPIAQAPPPVKQAVIETTEGTFIMDLTPESAPRQVAYFTKLANDGTYGGTSFHQVVKNGMVLGGDPLSKDPAKRAQYGTGGLNQVKAEERTPKMTAGSMAAVMVPGKPDSAGAQFFIVLADQPALDGKYSVFGRVADGMDVLMKISAMPVDASGKLTDRVEIKKITIRDKPPPIPEPFVNETVQELGTYRAVLDTDSGPITIEFFIDKAPNTVRHFMQLAAAGVYDHMAFHRVAPGFVIQTGALHTRAAPLTLKQQGMVTNLPAEDNDTKHVKGIVSMARGEDPNSAQTSFFICTGASTALDGHYTAFGRVVDGMAVVDAIEGTPRDGETPKSRIELKTVKIEKK